MTVHFHNFSPFIMKLITKRILGCLEAMKTRRVILISAVVACIVALSVGLGVGLSGKERCH